jgi:hypothetical protein
VVQEGAIAGVGPAVVGLGIVGPAVVGPGVVGPAVVGLGIAGARVVRERLTDDAARVVLLKGRPPFGGPQRDPELVRTLRTPRPWRAA